MRRPSAQSAAVMKPRGFTKASFTGRMEETAVAAAADVQDVDTKKV